MSRRDIYRELFTRWALTGHGWEDVRAAWRAWREEWTDDQEGACQRK